MLIQRKYESIFITSKSKKRRYRF